MPTLSLDSINSSASSPSTMSLTTQPQDTETPIDVLCSPILQSQSQQQQFMQGPVTGIASVHSYPAHVNNSQQGSSCLKVENALSYLDEVKIQFKNQPEVYNEFLDIMKEFKSQSMDTLSVIHQVSTLFKGYPHLILGFNSFLPPGYKIRLQNFEPVNFTAHSQKVQQPMKSDTTETATVTAPLPKEHSTIMSSTSDQNVTHGNMILSTATSASIHPISESTQSQQLVQESQSNKQPEPVSNRTVKDPVGFKHAINYVNKVKSRFQNQPDVYREFLEVLHAYQKQQKGAKEDKQGGCNPLLEIDVYAHIARLFQDQEDLLEEFSNFLPEVVASENKEASTSVDNKEMSSSDVTTGDIPTSSAECLTTDVQDNSTVLKKVVTSTKHPAPSMWHCFPKRRRLTSFKDVSLAEAGKFGTLSEFAFFDQVRKALRSQDVYENFLKCLMLYNEEIVSSSELVYLVTPFLGKFSELLKWLKNFLGYEEGSKKYETFSAKYSKNRKEKLSENDIMEIDYSSCKKSGASYRALPQNYPHPKSSGRTPLCKEVLNDTWVSFPCWSEDSTFVSSRKTQFEEYMYRCEDERFELDVVLEINLSTIRVLEGVQKKISRMTPEEKDQFHLDDTLGGTSATVHQCAIKRIYGEKATDIIEGLKKNPVVALPLVIRRLKAKDEEWREAQKVFNQTWREQIEKYYLKSLDHQGVTFKQNDIKALRTKSLLNEIETVFEECHEKIEEGARDALVGPHLTVKYSDQSVLDDAAMLIFHYLKRLPGLHKDDKRKVRDFVRNFIPKFFLLPCPKVEDESEDDDDSTAEGKSNATASEEQLHADDKGIVDLSNEEGKNVLAEGSDINSKKQSKEGPSINIQFPTNCSESDKVVNDDQKTKSDDKKEQEIYQQEISLMRDESYALLFGNSNWYLFFRLHNILCERLTKIYWKALQLAAEVAKEKKDKKETSSLQVRLKTKSNTEVEDFYPSFLKLVKNVIDGDIEGSQYEDTLREMFGVEAYIAYTLDRVVQNTVRQLQHLVCDESCIKCAKMYQEEVKNGGGGGLCATMLCQSTTETAYQKKVEQALNDESCFRIVFYRANGILTFELIDTEIEDSDEGSESHKLADYIDRYLSEDEVPVSKVFLLRNLKLCKHLENYREDNFSKLKSKKEEKTANLSNSNDQDAEIPILHKRKSEQNIPEKWKILRYEESWKVTKDMVIIDDTECKFDPETYKMSFVSNTGSYLYKPMCLTKAQMSHQRLSKKWTKLFHCWHERWLDSFVSRDMKSVCRKWLLGEVFHTYQYFNTHSEEVRIHDLNRPPYRPYSMYRVHWKDEEL